MLAFTVISALHWIGVGAYVGSLIFLLFIFERVYHRYRSYTYVDNFRAEVVYLYWKFLHVAFATILLSGSALAGLKGRSVLAGPYGLVFSLKLVLWLVQIYLAQDFLKPFKPELHNKEPQAHARGRAGTITIAALLLLIAVCGFALKHL